MVEPNKDEGQSHGTSIEPGRRPVGIFKNGNWAKEIDGGLGYYAIHNKQEHSNVFNIKPFLKLSPGFTSCYFDMAFTPRVGNANHVKKGLYIIRRTARLPFNRLFQAERFETGF